TRCVVLGVCRETQLYVQGKANGISLDLHVAFLHHIEQANLHLAREIRKFVEREDAAVGARQHPVVNRQFIGEHVPSSRGTNGIEISNHVGDRHVRRGELLHIPAVAIDPRDGRVIARFVDQRSRVPCSVRLSAPSVSGNDDNVPPTSKVLREVGKGEGTPQVLGWYPPTPLPYWS